MVSALINFASSSLVCALFLAVALAENPNYNYHGRDYNIDAPDYAYDYYESGSDQGRFGLKHQMDQNYYRDYQVEQNLQGPVNHIEEKSGYAPKKPETKYVPVVVKKKKKKQKIISINKGVFIRGGVQVFGKFKSLKACMKACGATPTCFAGDYNPWLGKCYFHSNVTACNNQASHSKITHFKKVPCVVTDAPRGRIILGAQLFGAVVQKGIDDLSTCLKKCANGGMGIDSATPTDLDPLVEPFFIGNLPLCYGINYDFGTHQCYFITSNYPRLLADSIPVFSICPIAGGVPVRVPVDLAPNPAVVTIILCPAIGAAPAAAAP